MDPATQSRKSSGVIAAAEMPALKSGLNFRHRRANDDCGNNVGFTSMNFKLYSSVRTINIGIALIVTSAPTKKSPGVKFTPVEGFTVNPRLRNFPSQHPLLRCLTSPTEIVSSDK